MALRINIEDNSILHAIPLIHQENRTALVSNAYVTLLVHLQATVERVESSLLELATKEANPRLLNLLTLDIWSVLDTSHRIFILLKQIGVKVDDAASNKLEDDVKNIRDSFQHLNERLDDYYQHTGLGSSVFGDYTWKFRATSDTEATRFICKSGVTFAAFHSDTKDASNVQEPDTDAVGIYELSLTHVKREVVNLNKKQFNYMPITVSIDQIIKFVNKTTGFLEYTWENQVHSLMVANNVKSIPHRGFPPIVITEKK